MASSSSLLQREKVYFILMKECVIEKRMKGSIFSKPRDRDTGTALPGSLWYLTNSELKQVGTVNRSKNITFHSAEQTDSHLQITEWHDIIQLTNLEFELLQAVTTCKERAVIYKDNEGCLLHYVCQLYNTLQSPQHEAVFVEISVDAKDLERHKGELKYIGPVTGYTGYWFGIELQKVIL